MKKMFFSKFVLAGLFAVYSFQCLGAPTDLSKKTDFLFSIDEPSIESKSTTPDLSQQTTAQPSTAPLQNLPEQPPTVTPAPTPTPPTATPATPPAPQTPALPTPPAAQTPAPPQAVPNIERVVPIGAPPSLQNIETGIKTNPNQPAEAPAEESNEAVTQTEPEEKRILINFNNVGMIEYIRFISRLSNKNFIFDENDLQFNVTIVSEEPTTIDNIMTALLQELRIRGLLLLEQGNNLIIHRNPDVHALSKVLPDNAPISAAGNADIVTKVFALNTLEAPKAAEIIRPMVSTTALIESVKDTNHLIVTDLVANINQISQLLKSIDSPKSGQVIGQYVGRNAPIDILVELTKKIMQPIAGDQPLLLVPHASMHSIFIVSTPYLVERTIAVMQYLDKTEGLTQILNPRELENVPTRQRKGGQWVIDSNGNWIFQPELAIQSETPPQGYWDIDSEGNWHFTPGLPTAEGQRLGPGGQRLGPGGQRLGPGGQRLGPEGQILGPEGQILGPEGQRRGPEGRWVRDPNNKWVFLLRPGASITAERLMRPSQRAPEIPIGHIERTKFYIHKLHYRNADKVVIALGRIATSLQQSGISNAELVSTINSAQGIESSNSLIFTGSPDALAKVKELVEELDTPVRQVLVEMLIIQTTLANSLTFSTNFASEFGGGRTAGGESFLTQPNPSPPPPSILGIDFQQAVNPPIPPNIPTVRDIIAPLGFNLGIIGQHITMGGLRFNTIGALVNALHNDLRTDVLLTPKIVTEENVPAQVFVGQNVPYPIQSISNDIGSTITNNFDYRDVGTLLKVTPLIGDNDIITLTIEQELTNIVSGTTTIPNSNNVIIGPTTNKTKTVTKVHLPDGFFIIVSGQVQEQTIRNRTQVPCLGSIPILGALFSNLNDQDNKNNLLIFIRPSIIETEDQIQDLTRHQQGIWNHQRHIINPWKWETEGALDFFNLSPICEPEADWTWE